MKVKFKIQGVEFIGKIIEDYSSGGQRFFKISLGGRETFIRVYNEFEFIEKKKYLRLNKNIFGLLKRAYGTNYKISYVQFDTESNEYDLGHVGNVSKNGRIQTSFNTKEIEEIKSIYGDIFVEEGIE